MPTELEEVSWKSTLSCSVILDSFVDSLWSFFIMATPRSAKSPIAKSALTILINNSTDLEILKSLAEDNIFLESILSRITNRKEVNATLLSMLLSNLAKSDSFERLLSLKRSAVPTLRSTATNAFDQLLDLFNRG
ncbi:MAG: hypothetical protein Q9223_006557, partial [Gallowayella weberi]